MNKISELWKNYQKPLIIGLGGLILLIIIVIIIIVIANIFKKYDYQELEEHLVAKTKEYLADHTEALPTELTPMITIDTTTLANEKYIRDFNKITKDSTCQATIDVHYNEGNYYLIPHLSCLNYTTTSLKEHILQNEAIKESDDGLYNLNNFYTYRGEFVNNYLNFLGYTWRIVKFNDTMTYLILADTLNNKLTYPYDDRYNETINSNRGYNTFETSRIYDTLLELYNNDLQNYHQYLLQMDACTHTRSENDTDKTGAIECTTTMKTPITLLSVYDYLNASIDQRCVNSTSRNCSNYNYLATSTNRWWLLNGTNENTYEVYCVNQTGIITLQSANIKKALRMVIAIPSNLVYKSGNGTSENPYTFYEY